MRMGWELKFHSHGKPLYYKIVFGKYRVQESILENRDINRKLTGTNHNPSVLYTLMIVSRNRHN